jgi:hypothetical protein
MAAFAAPLIGAGLSMVGNLLGMGGPSAAQKQDLSNMNSIGNNTQQFFNSWLGNANTTFGQQQNILSGITSNLMPILQAGPSQKGFSPEEEAALNTQTINASGAGYAKEKAALGVQQGAEGGGNIYLPSGASRQQDAALASSSINNLNNQQLSNTLENYKQGNRNYTNALSGLGSTAQELNPNAYANTANTVGSSAFGDMSNMASTQAQLDASKNAGITSIFSSLGGGFGNLDTTGSSTKGEQAGNFFSGL